MKKQMKQSKINKMMLSIATPFILVASIILIVGATFLSFLAS